MAITNITEALDALKDLAEALPAAVTVDDTLSVEGAAADAKATGEAISDLNNLVGDTSVSEQISAAMKVTSVGGQTGDVMNPTFTTVTADKIIGAVYA